MIFTNPNCAVGLQAFQPTAQAGRLSLTYTSGPAIINVGTIAVAGVGTSGIITFQYNYLFDGWIRINNQFDQSGNNSEFAFSIPYEAMVDLCNQVGANTWMNFGTTSSSYITSVTQLFGNTSTGLTSGLQFGFEAYNEVWNPFAAPIVASHLTHRTALSIIDSIGLRMVLSSL